MSPIGRHSDEDADGVADHTEANPYATAPVDLQAVAFHDAERTDLVDDNALGAATVPASTREPIRSPEDWEAVNWDAERVGPKSLDEAKAALAERVANPNAPDTDATVYDTLAGDR